MWSPLNKNYVSQEGIRDIKSIEVRKFSSRDIMKMSIERTKSLFWVDEVADCVHNEDVNQLDRRSHCFEQTKSPIKHKEKSPLERKLKLSLRWKLSYFLSFFFLLVCFVYAFLVVAQGMSNVSGGECMWWDHSTTVQKSSLGGVSTVIKKASLLT